MPLADRAFAPLYSLYEFMGDVSLAQRLGLSIDPPPLHGEWIDMGTVTNAMCQGLPEGVTVAVGLAMYPAHFWRFDVRGLESGKAYRLSTGSGALAEYWPAALQFARNMISVAPLPDGITVDQSIKEA